jgi:hypothetical protein
MLKIELQINISKWDLGQTFCVEKLCWGECLMEMFINELGRLGRSLVAVAKITVVEDS